MQGTLARIVLFDTLLEIQERKKIKESIGEEWKVIYYLFIKMFDRKSAEAGCYHPVRE